MTISIYQNFPNQIAQDFFGQSVINSSKPYDVQQICYTDSPNFKNKQLTELLQESSNLALKEGYQIDTNYWFTEVHTYKVDNQQVSSPFAWHQDDYGGWNEQVLTILWYIKKDISLLGGDLLWCDIDPYPYSFIKPIISKNRLSSYPILNTLAKHLGMVKRERPEINRIVIKEGMVVVMRGDTWHTPEDIKGGKGNRDLVVVQFKHLR